MELHNNEHHCYPARCRGRPSRITAIYADAVINGTASYELEPPDPAEMRRASTA